MEVHIVSPTLIVPFSDATHKESECWVWNFGDLKINSAAPDPTIAKH